MMWPSSQASKILTFLLYIVFVYCVYMDTFLYLRIRNYKVEIFGNITDAVTYEDVTWIPCTVNPLCHPTVKGLMVDHINHYIYGPLCALLDVGLKVSENMRLITPNMISFFHVLIAVVGGKFLTCQNLAPRRVAVVLFQIRMFLDDLDGHVARERKHIKGEHSEVGSVGYWVDGICDLLGVTAMMIGVLVYLKNNPPRRGYRGTNVSTLPYHQLKEINMNEDLEKDHNSEGISYKTKVSVHEIIQKLVLFSGQMILSSLAWNRYIDVYQDLLENRTDYDLKRREGIFKSRMFFVASGLWRIVNPHCYIHLLSLAIFCDKIWGFLTVVHCGGYVVLVCVTVLSEFLVVNMRMFVVGQ